MCTARKSCCFNSVRSHYFSTSVRKTIRYILSVIVIAIFGFMMWKGYEMYSQQSQVYRFGYSAIPTDAIVVFSSNQILSDWNAFAQNNLIWEELTHYAYFHQVDELAKQIDSLADHNPILNLSMKGHIMHIASLPAGSQKRSYLLIIELPNASQAQRLMQEVQKYLPDNGKTESIRGIPFTRVDLGSFKVQVGLLENLIIITQSLTEAEKSLAAYQTGKNLEQDVDFAKVRSAVSNNPDVIGHVFANTARMDQWMNAIGNSELLLASNEVFPFAGWTSLDLYAGSNSLGLDGLSIQLNENGLAGIFRGQQPVEPQFHYVVPARTSAILGIALSDKIAFMEALCNHRFQHGLTELREELSNYNNTYSTDSEILMWNWVGNELVSFIIPYKGFDHHLMAFRIDAAHTHAERTILQYAVRGDTGFAVPDTLTFRDKKAWQINLPVSYKRLLGNAFSDSTRMWFSKIDDYIVMANSKNGMMAYFEQLDQNRLADMVRYDAIISSQFSQTGNLYLLFSPGRGQSLLSKYGNDAITAALNDRPESFRNFEWLAIQFRSKGKQMTVNALADYNPAEKQNTLMNWEFRLDNPILGKVHFIQNHRTNGVDLFIQDMTYSVYLVSSTGKLRWKKELEGPILGDVSQVDLFDNGKYQMTFVCADKLFLVDILGRDVKGFPVKADGATHVASGRYDKDSFRFFVSTHKGSMLIDQDGEKVKGWNPPDDLVPSAGLEYLKIAGDDLIAMLDTNGRAVLLNRKGEIKHEAKATPPLKGSKMIVEKGSDPETSRISYLDNEGRIIRLYMGGLIDSIPAQVPEQGRLELLDVNGDNSLDYLVIGNRTLKAWARDKSTTLQWKAEAPLNKVYGLSDFGGLKTYIAVSEAENGKLYVLDAAGNEVTRGKFTDVHMAQVTDLNKDNRLELIVVQDGNLIRQFPLP